MTPPAQPSGEEFHTGDAVAEAISNGRTQFHDVRFVGCDLAAVDWGGVEVKGGRFERCSFGDKTKRSDVAQARFERVTFQWCDFRRCTISSCTFKTSHFEWCDLYRAALTDGTTFEGARFRNCSLYRCELSGCDMAMSNIADDEGELVGIVQLSAASFEVFHSDFDHVDTAQQATLVAGRRPEAIEILRTLGGHFLQKGNFVDEGVAYYARRSLDFEEAVAAATQRPTWGLRGDDALLATSRRWLNVAGLWLAKATCGFGERLGRVAATMVVVVAVVAVVLWATGGVIDEQGQRASLAGALLTATVQVAGQSPADLRPASTWAELILGVENLIAISLAGLFGFILANRIRTR